MGLVPQYHEYDTCLPLIEVPGLVTDNTSSQVNNSNTVTSDVIVMGTGTHCR